MMIVLENWLTNHVGKRKSGKGWNVTTPICRKFEFISLFKLDLSTPLKKDSNFIRNTIFIY